MASIWYVWRQFDDALRITSDMLEFLSTYTYFTLSLALFGLFLTAYGLLPRQRRLMLLGALVSTPTAFYAVAFVPEYWDPVQLLRFGAGPEDLIFSFSVGGLVWLIVPAAHSGYTMHVNIRPWRMVRACLGLMLVFHGVWLSLWQIGMGVMSAELVASAVLVVVVVALRPHLWRIVAAGPLLFALPYTVFVSLVLSVRPQFLGQWNLQSLSDLYVLGIPLEETAWALSYGAAWPLSLAYLFDLRLSKALQALTNLGPTMEAEVQLR